MQDTWTMQNEASAAQKTLATKIQLRLRRSCGRGRDMIGEPESTRGAVAPGVRGMQGTPRMQKVM